MIFDGCLRIAFFGACLMQMFSSLLALVGSLLMTMAMADAREWSSLDGQYKIIADVIAF
ncbi:secreted protein [Rhodopirellula maiorica SM1]|uniref:Secreted protein n=1 Tax=Rhodopirellula maiorica SM1 TaxID=1265738 RepID=M5R8K5_9BACT|nr:secreted protein [Rhodopirellula maiorica SM1]